jgi:hypothetical protein
MRASVPRTLSDPFIPIAHWRWLYFCSSRAWDMLNCTLGRLDACMAGFLGEAGSEPPYCPPPAAMPRLVQKATMEDGMSSWEKIKHQPCVFFRSLFALLTRLGEAIAMACFLLLTLPPLPPGPLSQCPFCNGAFPYLPFDPNSSSNGVSLPSSFLPSSFFSLPSSRPWVSPEVDGLERLGQMPSGAGRTFKEHVQAA